MEHVRRHSGYTSPLVKFHRQQRRHKQPPSKEAVKKSLVQDLCAGDEDCAGEVGAASDKCYDMCSEECEGGDECECFEDCIEEAIVEAMGGDAEAPTPTKQEVKTGVIESVCGSPEEDPSCADEVGAASDKCYDQCNEECEGGGECECFEDCIEEAIMVQMG